MEVGGKPNFWLYPLDKYHMEIADESQLKTKIMLYFLCLTKPVSNLKELPSHEAEYDMIDKTGAEKEREDREKMAMKEISIMKSPRKSSVAIKGNFDKAGHSASKLPSITSAKKFPPSNVVSQKKQLPKGTKEWWEKYNFSNPVLIRYRFENKNEGSNPVVGHNFYVL